MYMMFNVEFLVCRPILNPLLLERASVATVMSDYDQCTCQPNITASKDQRIRDVSIAIPCESSSSGYKVRHEFSGCRYRRDPMCFDSH